MDLSRNEQRVLGFSLAGVFSAFAISCALYRINGGFGGGHGGHDAQIFLLALPWALVATILPESVMNHTGDFTLFVVLPFILNLILLGGLWALLRGWANRRGRTSE